MPVRRVLAMLTAAYPGSQLFGISMVPKTAGWGKKTDFENKERILCTADTNKPYLIWIVGKISSSWFFDRDEYAEKPNITIIPVDLDDATVTTNWLTRLARPPRGKSLLFASRARSLTVASPYPGESTRH